MTAIRDSFSHAATTARASHPHETGVAPKNLHLISMKPFKEDATLLSKIGNSKISLADAIKQAATMNGNGFPVQAKLEMNDAGDQISMSIYTAKDRKALPEANAVTETSGDPTGAKWSP